jgi:hypothetical protein
VKPAGPTYLPHRDYCTMRKRTPGNKAAGTKKDPGRARSGETFKRESVPPPESP